MTANNSNRLIENTFKKILKSIHQYIRDFSDDDISVLDYQSPEELSEKIDVSLAKSGVGLDHLPQMIDQYLQYSVRTGHPRFANQLFSGFNFAGFVGEIITALTNTSMYTYEVSPVATLIEKECIKTLLHYCGFDGGEGTFVTGGSNANLIALMAARNQLLPTVKTEGMSHNRLRVYVSEKAHYSFDKAVDLLGIGLNNLVKIKSDGSGKMKPQALLQAIKADRQANYQPMMIAATAGTTVIGAFDPITEISKIAQKESIWLHVDGSWGGSILLSEQHKDLLKGLEKTQSFTWDTHKLMNMPLICSVILFNKKNVLIPLNDVSGTEYLYHQHQSTSLDLGHYSLQCGRKVDALKLWLAWKVLGKKGFEKSIDHLFEIVKYAGEIVKKEPRLELLMEPPSLNLCFRYLGKQTPEEPIESEKIDSLNIAIRDEFYKKGKYLVNYSAINGRIYFRMVFANKSIDKLFVDTFFQEFLKTAGSLEKIKK